MEAPTSRASLVFFAKGLALAVGVALTFGSAAAQQAPPAAAATIAKSPKPTASTAPAQKPSKGDGDSSLKQRVDALEEQLVDMQVMVGTLETLAKSGGAASASPAYRAGSASADAPAVDSGRLIGLESQVRALTAQVQALTDQVRTLGGQPRRADAVAVAPLSAAPSAPAVAGFGTATVSTEQGYATDGPGPALAAGGSSEALPPTSTPPPDAGNPRQAYEQAYSYLLQQDYGAAETAFDDFLKRYPTDNLAGNAQFWLGESYYVRGQFKPAAAAFLKGFQTYGRSAKAPDSLLKLAMSLGKLGQKDAACSSLSELGSRFPTASAEVKSRAVAEKQRTGCP